MTATTDPPGRGSTKTAPDRREGASQSGHLKCSQRPPGGLSAGGKRLWRSVVAEHDLDATQLVQLEEACRAKDRCDRFASLLAGGHDSKIFADANATANLLKLMIAALRLPDSSGRRPQHRAARGVYRPRQTRTVGV